MGKRMAMVFMVLVLSGSLACAQSMEQKLQAFLAATPRPQRVEDFRAIPHLPLKSRRHAVLLEFFHLRIH